MRVQCLIDGDWCMREFSSGDGRGVTDGGERVCVVSGGWYGGVVVCGGGVIGMAIRVYTTWRDV